MKIKIIILALLSSHIAFGFNKDFEAINDRVPYEFNLLFRSLKIEAKNPADQFKMVALSKDLNDNLGFLSKEHIFMLMKTEVVKGVMEYKFEKVRKFDVNNLLVSRLQENFTNKQKYLNPFSKWIFQSIIAELKHRQNLGLIKEQSFNAQTFEGNKKQDALRFQRYLNYLMPWMDRMDSLTATQFNDLATEVSWSILQRINERSILFGRYASTAAGDTKTVIINIPQKLQDLHPEDIKKLQAGELPLSLKEQSLEARDEAIETMEKVTPLDMSTISDDVARELEEKTN